MRVHTAIISAAAALTTALAASNEANLNGWFPCDVSANGTWVGETDADMEFECGEVDVPLCHEGICDSDRTIALFVKRLAATTTESSDATPKTLWMLQGGPGMSSRNLESAMLAIHRQLEGAVNVYTTDHRGTGRSHFLTCDAAQAFTSGSPWGVELSPSEVPTCLQDMLHQVDDQPQAFSVTSAAKDIEYLINGLNADEDVYLYGASYGTYWVERVMHLTPEIVKGYILDGVVPEDDPTFTTIDLNTDVPTQYLAEYCEAQKPCADMFTDVTTEPASVYETWKAMLADLDSTEVGVNMCADLFRVHTFGEERVSTGIKKTLEAFRGDVDWRRIIPALLKITHRCQDENDLLVLRTYLDTQGTATTVAPLVAPDSTGRRQLQSTTPQTVDVIMETSTILHSVIKSSEMWAWPSPSWEEHMDNYYDLVLPSAMVPDWLYTCLFRGNITDPSCSVLQAASEEMGEDYTDIEPVAFNYEPDEYFGEFATIPDHASALVINGKLDFNTPSVGGVRQYENMEGGHGKMMVDMDFGGHCVGISPTDLTDMTDCGIRIIASYLAADGDVEAVDTSCMEELPLVNLLGLDEVFGGGGQDAA